MTQPLLHIDALSIAFRQQGELRTVVNDVSLHIDAGETLALVGESGSGKSVTALSVLRLLPAPPVVYPQGDILFHGQSLLHADERTLRGVRGNKIAMIFQEPMVSLNPLHTLEKQLYEVLSLHRGMRKEAARGEMLDCLERTGIRNAAKRLADFPHQLSGGERQRVMIAMALLTRPELLIADEPTTALDVTIQAQIIELLLELQQKENMALILITHDLALVAEAAHKIIVMYAGQVVETGDAKDIFRAPRHPYTQALLRALPEFAQDKARLASLPGVVPGKYDRPSGCLLNPRCPYATDKCRSEEPELNLLNGGRQSKCHYPLDDAGRPGL